MFNVGPFELLIIVIAVLLIFPPKQLPDIARTVGKFLREFRRQTEEVRSTIEKEFYQMDQELSLDSPPKSKPAESSPALPANNAAVNEGGAQPNEHVFHEGETPTQPNENVFHEGETPAQSSEHVFHEGEIPTQPNENVFHEGELPPGEAPSTFASASPSNGAAATQPEAAHPTDDGIHSGETRSAEVSPASGRTEPQPKVHP